MQFFMYILEDVGDDVAHLPDVRQRFTPRNGKVPPVPWSSRKLDSMLLRSL